MNRDVRRAALRSAAHVAFGASFACSPTTAPKSEAKPEPLPTVSQTAPAPTLARVPNPKPESPDDCAIALDADGGVTKGSFDCCLATTKRAVADSDPRTPGFTACCNAIAREGYLSYWAYQKSWNLPTCQACADAINNRGACTPWGPPMPPAMTA